MGTFFAIGLLGILSAKISPNKSLVKAEQSFRASHPRSARTVNRFLLVGLPIVSIVVAYNLTHRTSSPPAAPQAADTSANKPEMSTLSATAADPAPQSRNQLTSPAYFNIEPYETTADEAFALLNKDSCALEDQTVKPDSKMPDSLEIKKIYSCGNIKLQLYFNRTDAAGPYMVTFKSYVH